MVLDFLSGVLLAGGSVFILIGAIGLVRLPDFYTRMHGAGIVDTLGAGLFIAGLMLQGGLTLTTAKLLLMFIFIMFASPTSSYALANAALSQGVEPQIEDDGEDAPSNP
ncbi:monovalent cation/H(+) antiporter subunit G [bacterium AH-315-B06]|nr:monovalent cation/H(+) antiporter subunit G [bacterium AH-315-B06]